MKKLILIVATCVLANAAVAQSASDDPCGLTLFNFDRTVNDGGLDGAAYTRDVKSMLAVATATIAIDSSETLLAVRYACARLPTETFLHTVVGVIHDGLNVRSGMSNSGQIGAETDPLVLGAPLIIDGLTATR